MPRIFDNIGQPLLPALQNSLAVAERADFCVGYFNLRGWHHLAGYIDKWSGGSNACRLLVGMHVSPSEELRQALRTQDDEATLDNQTAMREKRRIAEEFRQQLTFGAPTNADEATLRRLSAQIRGQKLAVKVYLRHPLHAKLYLLHRQDTNNPITGFLGSSNLTLAGLSKQGELNVDVLEHDACNKLASWFEDRWNDRWCIDISKELADIIDESWAAERLLPPYHVYLKMAYHLAQEARAGLSEFRIPSVFGDTLFDFQVAAVKIAAHHLNKRGGVLIGDVVGLGKSMMATALAKIFEDDYHTETLIICPKNLVSMWEDYVHRYRLHAKVLPLSKVINELPEKTRRYRLVLIDESHNLRNKAGKRWRVIREYIERNESLAVLLSATPYNKTYLDLSAQLALFLNEDADIGVRPEHLLTKLGGEHEFVRRHQCGVRTLAAFEKSEIPDDWRELMRLYMVRRTRGFIMQHYAQQDERGKFLLFSDGRKSYFPKRLPKNLSFKIDETNPADPYARFYSDTVVNAINALILPRYGLGNYIAPRPKSPPTQQEAKVIEGLSRAGTRLMGFCRTNLFKRLESAGPAFILSIERHILRNFIVLHALENGLEIPLGTQGAELLDTRYYDEDPDGLLADEEGDEESDATTSNGLRREEDYRARAAQAYEAYSGPLKTRFKWLPGSLFVKALAKDLLADAQALLGVLHACGDWEPDADNKLSALADLIQKKHPKDKEADMLIEGGYDDFLEALGGGEYEDPDYDPLRNDLQKIMDRHDLSFAPDSKEYGQMKEAHKFLRRNYYTDLLAYNSRVMDFSFLDTAKNNAKEFINHQIPEHRLSKVIQSYMEEIKPNLTERSYNEQYDCLNYLTDWLGADFPITKIDIKKAREAKELLALFAAVYQAVLISAGLSLCVLEGKSKIWSSRFFL